MNEPTQVDAGAKPEKRIQEMGEQLRSKISSKYQTTAFLGGFCFTTLGVQLSVLWQGQKLPVLLPASIGAMAFALVLYLYGMYRLDGLTMPKRFWDQDPANPDRRASREAYLTEDDLFALKERMVFFWSWLTLAGLGLTGLSLLLMVFPAGMTPLSDEVVTSTFWWTGGAVMASVVYLVILGWRGKRQFKHILLNWQD